MKNRMTKMLGWLLCASLVGMAHAQAQPNVAEPLGEAFKVPRLLVKQQSRIVFYRLPNDVGHAAATVYVNGAYQASVQRGAFSELCVPPSNVEVSARMVKNGQFTREDFDVVNTLELQGGQDTFVRVSEQANGRAILQKVKPELALPDLVKTRAQRHTLSRVPNAVKCQDEAEGNKPVAVKARSITLGADALFAFGKSDIGSIPPKGRRTLDHLIDRIKTEFGTGDQVRLEIIGHADSFGAKESNLRLSKERAATIKTYFANGGLRASNISTDGRGDAEPVVLTCGKKLTAANVECNKPNRRVVVTVKVMKPASEPTN